MEDLKNLSYSEQYDILFSGDFDAKKVSAASLPRLFSAKDDNQ